MSTSLVRTSAFPARVHTCDGVRFTLVAADCLAWMADAPAQSIHAIVTDRPTD